MALDAALLESAQETGLGALRLYGWNPGTLSFGRNEPALRRYDRDAIRQRGLSVVRRPTGGRAVWHEHEVTYAIAAPTSADLDLRASYHEIHAMLAEALKSLGAPVSLAADRPANGVGAGACFASSAGGEVIANGGRKIVGSAQVRSGDAFLQHGSILLVAGQGLVADVTRGAADAPSQAGLTELIPPDRASFEAVSEAVSRAARRRWRVRARVTGSPERLRERAALLHSRFTDDRWTWRR